ncbi:MAG: citryl-CoA lyase [bacterium]
MEPWRTAISTFEPNRILIRGRPVEALMAGGNFADVAFLLLRGRPPSAAESRVWNAMLIAVADHGPTPPSTMAARVIASGNRRAVEAAVAGGLLAVGDAHGGAGEETMRMLRQGLALIADERLTVPAAAERVAETYRRRGERIPGVGHRVHTRDPRTETLWTLAQEAGLAGAAVELMRAVAAAARPERPLPVNVDGALAAVLVEMGFEPAVGKIVFLLGRCAGISAHVLEELTREKPMRIEVPFVYDGS